jgi:hypothetical protein
MNRTSPILTALVTVVLVAVGVPVVASELGVSGASPNPVSYDSPVGLCSGIGYQVGQYSNVGQYSGVGGSSAVENCSTPVSEAGAISGTVTQKGGDPVQGECVNVYEGDGNEAITSTITAADGTYTAGDLPKGSYTVEFTADCGTSGNFAPQWYKAAATASTSTPVAVSVGSTQTGINAVLAAGASISGTVTGTSAQPLTDTCVDAYTASTQVLLDSTQTGSDGTYSLDDLPVGSVNLLFEPACGDFFGSSSPYAAEWYNGVFTQSSAQAIPLSAGQNLTGYNADLTLGGNISGTVTEVSPAGAPAASCIEVVPAVQPGASAGAQSVYSGSTAGNGTYSIGGITPGSYDVEFISCNGEQSFDQWYDNVATQAQATAVTVTQGTTTSGINDVLGQVADASISGTVTGPGGAAVPDTCVEVSLTNPASEEGNEYGIPTYEVSTGAGGAYSVDGLNAGTYDVEFLGANCYGGTQTYVAQYWDGAASLAQATAITLDQGGSASGIDASLSTGGQITGTVSTKVSGSSEAVAGICVTAYPSGGGDAFVTATTTATGTYTLSGVPLQSVDVEFTSGCGTTGSYVAQWYDDASSAASATAIALSSSATSASGIDATLVHTSSTGAVSGTVTNTAAAPLSGVCVDVYQGSGSAPVGSATTAANGTYTVNGLTPGSDEIYFDPTCNVGLPDVGQWLGAKSTQATSNKFTVTAGATATGKNAVLVPLKTGYITGTVATTASTPSGIAGVCAEAFKAGTTTFVASGVSGYEGTYAISDLPAGSYDLEFSPTCGAPATYGTEWYQQSSTASGATPVKVTAGNATSMIDDQLPSVSPGGISGAVTQTGGVALQYVTVNAYLNNSFGNPGVVVASTTTTSSGAYDLSDLAPGSYDLQFIAPDGAVKWYNNVASQHEATAVHVTSGLTKSGVNDVFAAPGTVSGSMVSAPASSVFG